MKRSCLVAVLATALLSPAVSAEPSTDERLRRLEQLLDSQTLVQMLNRLEQLQREVGQLRGDVEVQEHTIEGLRQRQRELYVDTDRRLQHLETGGQGAAAAPVPAVLPATPPTPASAGAPASTVPPVATSTANPEAQKQAYQTAFELLREGRYEESMAGFHQYLATWPNGQYAANSQYWLGEANYVTRQFDTAVVEFQKVIDNFPGSNKIPDAMLKLGYVYYEKQEWNKARSVLTDLQTRYPDTTAGRLASKRLDRMKTEKR